jgi:ubiquinone/menaquinone biosynthesis C-methylase UbiE
MASALPDDSYVTHVAALERRLKADEALQHAVGGEFVAIGKLEYQLLRSLGLRDGHTVVDVGCGSGRLACQLAAFREINYVGCDVVPKLLSYAKDLCNRPDWRFVETSGTSIPCEAGTADFVCFFSVFTHLSHEDTFRYIREAHRVLKPGGVLVMSFLEFAIAGHWDTFAASVDGTRENSHLNQFLGRDAIQAWAQHAGFHVNAIHGGDTHYIPLLESVKYENGAVASGSASLGQSLAVLQKRKTAAFPRALTPLLNVSVRATIRPSDFVAVGFVVGGSTAQNLLVRAVGPTLAKFGVTRPLTQPVFTITHGTETVQQGSGWEDSQEMKNVTASVGAFSLNPGSTDAAKVVTLPPGNYSILVKSADAADEGEVVVEVYYVE